MTRTGIPTEGAELDRELIELRGGIRRGDILLTAIMEPISYEWAPAIQRHLS